MRALDFESHLFSAGRMAPRAVCLTAVDEAGARELLTQDAMYEGFARYIAEPSVWHSASFDLICAMGNWPELIPEIFGAVEAGHVHDTELRQQLIDNAQGMLRGWLVETDNADDEIKEGVKRKARKPRRIDYTLASVAYRAAGIKLNKGSDTWRRHYADLEFIPPEQWPADAVSYAVDDSVATLAAYFAQEAGVKFMASENDQVKAAIALRLASTWGLRTDPISVARFKAEQEDNLARLTERLQEVGLVKADGSRTMAVAKDMFAELCNARDVEIPQTPKGDVSLRAGLIRDVLAGDQEHPLYTYTEFGATKYKLSKDIPALERGVCLPIHTRFVTIQATGRVSSNGPSVQNWGRSVGPRECFVPRPGYVFVACDYAMLELRTLAQTCWDMFGYSVLREVLNAGRDAHLDFASRMYGWEYDEAVLAYDAGEKEVEDGRQVAKPVMFGKPGGMGHDALVRYARAYGVQLDRDRAKELDRQWHQAYPEMRMFFAHAEDIVSNQDGMLVLPRANFIRQVEYFTEACNTQFQGPGAAIGKRAMWEVAKGCYLLGHDADLFGCRPVNFIHDEIFIEAPEERVHEAGRGLERAMLVAANHHLPDVPMTCSAVAMRQWSKKARRTVDAQGRLIPWLRAA